MKKIFLTAVVLIATFSLYAQDEIAGGFRRAGTNELSNAMNTKKIKDSLGITDDQAKRVDFIEQDFMLKMRSVRIGTEGTEKTKKAALEKLEDERKTKLKEIITDAQIAKLDRLKQPPATKQQF